MLEAGTRVRTRMQPAHGHTRLPAYLQGKPATIVGRLGAFPFPDEAAANGGRARRSQLYTLQFAASDVWNDPHDRGFIRADLFEEYLEPA